MSRVSRSRTSRSRPARRDDFGVYLLVVVVTLACGVTATIGLGRVLRPMYDPTTGIAARPAYVPAPDPITRARSGLPPDTTDASPREADRNIRTIQVLPNVVYLVAGGQPVRNVSLSRPARSLLDIVDVVRQPDWIRNDGGVVTLGAALIFGPRTDITISAPVSTLVMTVKPGVYLGVTGGHLTVRGVTVQAGDDRVPREGEVGDGARPFVVASDQSRMDLVSSHFRYLGRDWNASYGVSWVRGATGSAYETTFEECFIGAFTAQARDISFVKNTFRNNALYGLDPHSSTTGLTIERNLAEGNGLHGIILSDHVTRSVVRYNQVRGNKVNGIMMDYASDQNVVEGNEVTGNLGDGIVLADSAQNRVVDNVIRGNRVGVHAYGRVLRANVVERNTIRDNVLAHQGADLSATNTLEHNGDYWSPTAVTVVWAVTVPLGVLLLLLTGYSRRQRVRVVARANQRAGLVEAGAA